MTIRAYNKAPSPQIQGGDKEYVDRELNKLKQTTDDVIANAGTLAPIDSPVFTGTPKAPTPVTADSSTLLATTAFVKAQGYITGVSPQSMSGDVTGTTSSNTIAANAVTYPKIQQVGAGKLLGNLGASAANVGELTVTQVLDAISSTRGSILYRGASGWVALPPGAAGNYLQSGGTGADPSWLTPPASPVPWTLVKKTADQTVTATTYTNVTELAFPVAANQIVAVRFALSFVTAGGFPARLALTGPAGPVRVRFGTDSAYSGTTNVPQANLTNMYWITGLVVNGPTAGTVSLATETSNTGGSIMIEKGSYLEYAVVG